MTHTAIDAIVWLHVHREAVAWTLAALVLLTIGGAIAWTLVRVNRENVCPDPYDAQDFIGVESAGLALARAPFAREPVDLMPKAQRAPTVADVEALRAEYPAAQYGIGVGPRSISSAPPYREGEEILGDLDVSRVPAHLEPIAVTRISDAVPRSLIVRRFTHLPRPRVVDSDGHDGPGGVVTWKRARAADTEGGEA